MARHPNQTKGLAQYTPRPHTIGTPQHTPAARIAGYTDESTVTRDAEALGRMQASKPSKPPHRHVYVAGKCTVCYRPQRAWVPLESGPAHNCHECGHLIVPDEARWFDEASGHIARHLVCHEKAGAR